MDLDIPGKNSMVRKIIYICVSIIVISSACSKKLVPAKGDTNRDNEYDVAQFDYQFVEALKQKLMGNDGEALKYFEMCIKVNPKSDAVYYQMAQILASGGDIRNAKKYVAKAIELDGNNLWYMMMLSGIYYQEKNIDSAIIIYEKAVKVNPENEDIQLTLGNLYIEDQKYDKANSIFDSFDKKYGVNDASTLSSVRSLMASGRFSVAKVKAEALLKEKPDEILYNGLYAEILRASGESEKAMEVYDRLIRNNPNEPQIQLSLADFLIEEKNYDELFLMLNTLVMNDNIKREEKIALFAKMLENPELIKDNNNKLTLAMMVLEAGYKEDEVIPMLRTDLLIRQGKLKEAAVRLEEMVRQKPENYFAWEKLLLTYLEAGDYENLTKRGEEASKRFNMSFLAKILYANGAIETGKFDVAIEELRKAEIIAADNKDLKVQILTMRADVYYRTKEYTKAFESFDEALKYDKDDITILNNYAYYLAEQELNLKEAEVLAKRVIEIEKENNTFLDTYGWVLYKRGKLSMAAKVFESIINSGEKPDAEWYEHYGFILQKQKKCNRAIEVWKTAVQLDPSKTHLEKEIENCKK